MEDLITVVVPVYKVEKYIDKCINSILNQTYKNLEIILVDDGSTDNCGKICDEYARKDNRIRVIHKENGGLSDARNAGIDIAKGAYISFVDPDDCITEDYIQYMYEMIKTENVKLAICNIKVIWKNTKIGEEKHRKYLKLNTKEALENLLFAEGIDISANGKLYSKELWKDIRFPYGIVYEDTAIMYKIFEKAKTIMYGDKNCYYYIARIGSISKQQGYNKNEEDYIKNTNEMLEFIQNKYPELESAVKRFDIYAKFRILRMLVFTKTRNKDLEKKIISGIRKNQKEVFNNKRTPKRDKIAIFSLKFGIPVFKIVWTLYCKITGRI